MSTTTTSTTALSSPVKPPAFQRVSGRRRIKDTAATVLVTLSVVVALIPLAWVLFTVVAKGLPALTSPTWFTHSLSGLTSSSMGGGIYHALNGVKAQGLPAQGTSRGLELIMPYTGILRLAREMIAELNDVRPQPLAFREVRDLTLHEGRLLANRDRSAEVEELRRRRQAGETIGGELAYD